MNSIIHHPKRLLPISGTHNFRDLGGYPCGDGMQTRWRTVFRCAHFANVSDQGWQQLAELDIRWLVDLREQNECDAAPTHWQGSPTPTTVAAPRSAGAYNNREMLQFKPNGNLAEARQRRVTAYCDKILGFQHAVAEVFAILAGEQPGNLAFHCMAGKDRTGFVAAVLLTWLGVPREYVVEDYLLTRDTAKENVPIHRANDLLALYGLENAGEDALQAMTEVMPECIIAALDQIDEKHGGIEQYVANACQLDSRALETVRHRLLEPIQ